MTAFLMSGGSRSGDPRPPAQAVAALHLEDLLPGLVLTSPGHRIDRNELVAFARTWDPLPFHVDEQAGIQAFGCLTAPGLYMLAVKQRLIHQLPPIQVVASLGYDDVRFLAPLRPGDTVALRLEVLSQRASRSKLDRGVVTVRLSLIDQDDRVVMSHLDTILVRARPADCLNELPIEVHV